MNFDRNTVIGFIVLGLLFFGYFYFNNKEQHRYAVEKNRIDSTKRAQDSIKRYQDSITRFKNQPQPTIANQPKDTTVAPADQLVTGTESITSLENDVIKINFTNKGAQPKVVELKKFKGPDSSTVKLSSTDFDKINYNIALGANKSTAISDVYFSDPVVSKSSDFGDFME